MNGLICAFTGRLGKDPDFKLAMSGKRYVTFSVAVDQNEHHTEERPEAPETTWVKVVAFEELAHRLEDEGRLAKGAQVYVEGRLKLEEWYSAQGEHRASLAVSAWTVQVMGRIGRRRATAAGAGGRLMTTNRKFRRCPACGVVRAAVDFKLVMSGYGPSGPPVRCPACGHVGPRWSFSEVPPPKGEEAAPRPSRRTYRRCPACGAVRLAVEFKRASGKPDYGQERPTRCPACGHVAPHWSFAEVEPPEEGEVAKGPVP
jgi:single stranded DNA-binding protein